MKIAITLAAALVVFIVACRLASRFVAGVKLDALRPETYPQICAVCGKGISSGWEVRRSPPTRRRVNGGVVVQRASARSATALSSYYCAEHGPTGAVPWFG